MGGLLLSRVNDTSWEQWLVTVGMVSRNCDGLRGFGSVCPPRCYCGVFDRSIVKTKTALGLLLPRGDYRRVL